MPQLQVEDPETGQPVFVDWEGEGLPTKQQIPALAKAAREKALAGAPKPLLPRLIDAYRETAAELEASQQAAPAFGGELWAARRMAEFGARQLAKVRRPVDWTIGQTLRLAAERSKANLADPAKRAALAASYGPEEVRTQEEANTRRLAAAQRMIGGEGTLGSEYKTAVGAPQTRAQAVSDTLLGAGMDFVSDPANLLIGGLDKLGRYGTQLQYVLGAALSGSAGLDAARKGAEIATLAREGQLSSPRAAAAATEALLSSLMAGFGARGAYKGFTRDQVLAALERQATENATLEATGVGRTPPEIASAVAALKPYAESMVKRRAEFTANVKELRKEQVAALKEAMAKLEADPTDASAQAVFDSLAKQAARPELPPEQTINPEAEATLNRWIGKRGQSDPITAQHALEGLQALLTGAGRNGRPLEHSRKMALLKVFGRDLYKITNDADAALQSLPLWEKVKDTAADVLIDAPRSLQASADLSATLRQGSIPTIYNLITHPIRTVKDVASAAHAFIDPKVYLAAEKAIRNNVYDYTAADGKAKTRVDLTKLGDQFGLDRATDLSMNKPVGSAEVTSDYFSEGAAEKVPVVGEVVKGSNRGYKVYMDTVRHRLWREWDEHLRDLGYTPEKNPQFWKDSAEAINELTGLAKLPHLKAGKLDIDLNQSGPLMRAIFFAPRFAYARLKLLGDIATGGARYQSTDAKTFFTKLEPVNPVRQQMLKVLGSYGAFYGSLLYALSRLVPGVDVEKDPRSSDFLKVKVGNTRFDVWGGLQQYARFTAQSVTGERKSVSTGEVRRIPGSPGDYAKRAASEIQTGQDLPEETSPFASDYSKVMQDFLEGKASPAVSYIRDVQRGGKDLFGKPAKLNPLERFQPFGYRDTKEAYADNPALAALVFPLSALGVGTQTFPPDTRETEAVREAKRLRTKQQPPAPTTPEKKLEKKVVRSVRAEHEVKIRSLLEKGDRIGAYKAWLGAKVQGYSFPDLRKLIVAGYDNPDENDASEE